MNTMKIYKIYRIPRFSHHSPNYILPVPQEAQHTAVYTVLCSVAAKCNLLINICLYFGTFTVHVYAFSYMAMNEITFSATATQLHQRLKRLNLAKKSKKLSTHFYSKRQMSKPI